MYVQGLASTELIALMAGFLRRGRVVTSSSSLLLLLLLLWGPLRVVVGPSLSSRLLSFEDAIGAFIERRRLSEHRRSIIPGIRDT